MSFLIDMDSNLQTTRRITWSNHVTTWNGITTSIQLLVFCFGFMQFIARFMAALMRRGKVGFQNTQIPLLTA